MTEMGHPPEALSFVFFVSFASFVVTPLWFRPKAGLGLIRGSNFLSFTEQIRASVQECHGQGSASGGT